MSDLDMIEMSTTWILNDFETHTKTNKGGQTPLHFSSRSFRNHFKRILTHPNHRRIDILNSFLMNAKTSPSRSILSKSNNALLKHALSDLMTMSLGGAWSPSSSVGPMGRITRPREFHGARRMGPMGPIVFCFGFIVPLL